MLSHVLSMLFMRQSISCLPGGDTGGITQMNLPDRQKFDPGNRLWSDSKTPKYYVSNPGTLGNKQCLEGRDLDHRGIKKMSNLTWGCAPL